MKRPLKPNIDHNGCNAYSALAHLYSAIRVEGNLVFATNIDGASDREVPDDMKGGIIVFAQEENELQLSTDKFISWIKDKTALNDGVVCWTIGRFLRGRYFGNIGKVYSEESLSVEITGISDDALAETTEELCKTFNQVDVLIKMYSGRNRIIIVNGEKNT